MDQPDSNGDGLQPQDLSSSCTLPIAFDLSKKSEDCLRKASAVEALHVVQPPGWYVGAGTSEGLTFPENACGLSPVAGEQIQPDNAFSNTTVTLSYVSRSHVFSSGTPLTANCPLYDVSTLTKKLSQHASGFEALPLVSEADGAPLCVEADPHCLQAVTAPVGVGPHEPFEFVLPAQVMQNVATGVCFLKHAVDLNGMQDGGDAATATAVEILTPLPQGGPIVCKLSQEENGCLQNGDCALWDPGACSAENASGELFTSPAEMQGERDSEVLFLISRTDQPLGVHVTGATRNICSSLSREYISPLDDPVSPPATPQDEIEDVFVLPQTASSPSGENFPEDLVTKQTEVDFCCPPFAESACVGETKCLLDNSNTESISQLSCQPLTDNNLDTEQALLEEPQDSPKDVQESGVVDKPEAIDKQQLNGSPPAKEARLERKVLPPRTGRGIRLEAIVQNITPSRFKASSARSTKKSHCSKVKVSESKALKVDREAVAASVDLDSCETVCTSEQETSTSEMSTCLQIPVQKEEEGDSSSCFKEGSTSDFEHTQSLSKYLHKGTSDDEVTTNASSTPTKKSEKRSSSTSNCKSSDDRSAISPLPPPKSHKKKSPGKQQRAGDVRNKSSPATKKAHTPKKKRKKHKVGQSSMFSPKEPEIKLKYVNYKEEKRDLRADTFSPFVHVERKDVVTCTVVNYPEEVKPTVRKGQHPSTSGFVSGVVPSTPFLQYGRVSMEASRRAELVCCFCGGAANALDLGDLHGPYYADGSKPESRSSAGLAGLKAEEEEDLSDSDSSFGAKGRKCASAVPSSWARRARQSRFPYPALGAACQRWTSDGDLSHSPAAKRSRPDGGAAESWYSPPVVPLDSNEYWLHEDCGIWSAGVFLVKGRLYGLEKAVKMAQDTVRV